MIPWLIWCAPIVGAIAVAASTAAPGRRLDRFFHAFGIGGIDSRRATIAALVVLSVVGFGTDAILTLATTLEAPWRQLDAFAAGAVAALSILMLAGWLNPARPGASSPNTSGDGAAASTARTVAPEHSGEEH